jgi:hypothetical protein
MFNHNKTTQNLGGHFVVNVAFIDDIRVREPDQRNARRLVYKYAVSMQQCAVKLFVCRAEGGSKLRARVDEERLLFSERRQERQARCLTAIKFNFHGKMKSIPSRALTQMKQ